MNIVDSEKENLVDLKWPRLLPENLRQRVDSPAAQKPVPGPNQGQIFQLTGWRGAGWRMVFLEGPPQ